MARGRHGSPPASALPKAQFEKVQDEVSEYQAGVNSNQMKSFGYNDVQLDFRRPDHYIRHIEPLESDLATTVEYDMDEQDQEWLDIVNADRKKEQLDLVSYEMFEIIMDRLEKEWFNLTKNLPKPDLAMPSEDSTCAVCDDSEGENSNAIVFCDGCNLAVHQDCYGVPYIPEGQWLCRKCTVSPEVPVECLLCPNEGGAFKQTIHGEWLHLLCAIWIPETRVVNEVFMEPITGVERISKQRWKLRCSVCGVRQGACIQCAKPSCFVAFHATCARKEKLLMPMKAAQGAEPVTLTCYCEKHLPREQQEIRAAALGSSLETDEGEDAEEEDQQEGEEEDIVAYSSRRRRHTTNHGQPHASSSSHNQQQLTPKSARAYAKTYKTGPPLVPIVVVNRIVQYISKVSMRKRAEFVMMMARYWSLKREARRGAPLLKRLHLEPWTSGTRGARTEGEMQMQLQLLQTVREDLVRVRDMIELCRRRETRKLRQHEVVQRLLIDTLFPHLGVLRTMFEKILNMDRSEYFKYPVSRKDVPDYFELIKHPMCWSQIEDKLEKNQYWDFDHFQHDVDLVLTNALAYNKVGSNIHKAANRIYGATRPLFVELQKLKNTHASNPPPYLPGTPDVTIQKTNEEADDSAMDTTQEGHCHTRTPNPKSSPDASSSSKLKSPIRFSMVPNNPRYISDFEPTMQTLNLLLAPEMINEDLNMEVDEPPILSLFKYQFAKMKPMEAAPEGSPVKGGGYPGMDDGSGGGKKGGKKGKKRDRKAEAERAKARKAEAAAKAAAAAPAPATVNVHLPLGRDDDEDLDADGDADVDAEGEPDEDIDPDGLELHDEALRKRAREVQAALDSSAGFRAPSLKITTSSSSTMGVVRRGGGGGSVSVGSATTISATGSATGSEGAGVPIPVPVSVPGSIVVNGHGTKKRGSLTSSGVVGQGHGHGHGLGIGDGGVPKVVNVDNRGSFQLFNQGWILPADQKRGGRSGGMSGERPPTMSSTVSSEPPRKKLKIDPSSGRKVSASSTHSEIHTPHLPTPSHSTTYSYSRPQSATGYVDQRHPSFDSAPDDRMKVDSVSPTTSTYPPSIHQPQHPLTHSQSLPSPYTERQRRLSQVTRSLGPGDGLSPILPPPSSPVVMMHPEGEDGIDVPHNVVTQPNGVVIIEKLDTPATRRERNMRRKAEKRKMMLMELESGTGDYSQSGGGIGVDSGQRSKLPFSPSNEDVSVRMVGVKGMRKEGRRAGGRTDGDEGDDEKEDVDGDDLKEDESALSEVSGSAAMEDENGLGNERMGLEGVDVDGNEGPSSSLRSGYRAKTRSMSGKGPHTASGRRSSRTEAFLDGTLVWAKAESYPWWPAVVFKDDNPLVPSNILSAYFEKRQKKKIKLYIVQFYDKQKSWQTVAREKLLLLGEDPHIDEEMLAENNAKQKWKSKQSRDLCIAAYHSAIADLDPTSSNNTISVGLDLPQQSQIPSIEDAAVEM